MLLFLNLMWFVIMIILCELVKNEKNIKLKKWINIYNKRYNIIKLKELLKKIKLVLLFVLLMYVRDVVIGYFLFWVV